MGNMQNSRNYIIKRAVELQEGDTFILNYNRYFLWKFVQEKEIESQWGRLGWLHVRDIWTGEDRIISTYSQYPFIVEIAPTEEKQN